VRGNEDPVARERVEPPMWVTVELQRHA
jgi:hypothetical protein